MNIDAFLRILFILNKINICCLFMNYYKKKVKNLHLSFFSEQEKQRRWQEIRIRQHRLLSQSEHATPAHIEQIMKSGFSMSDIKGF